MILKSDHYYLNFMKFHNKFKLIIITKQIHTRLNEIKSSEMMLFLKITSNLRQVKDKNK